jgi:TPP-dependent pyruvate/acetoin dehydrogenase alpha subunit
VVFVGRTGAGGAGREGGGDRLLPAIAVAELARARDIESTRVDGTDVLAVVQAVAAARQRALDGAGATLVEAVLGSAAAADGDGAGGDPVGLLRDYLEHRGIWDAAREEDLHARVRQRLDEAVEAARATGPPPPDSLFTDVYAAPPWMLQEQRELAAGGAGAGDDSET